MIQVKPKSQLRKFIKKSAKILLVAEFLAFAGSYIVWYRMNRQQGEFVSVRSSDVPCCATRLTTSTQKHLEQPKYQINANRCFFRFFRSFFRFDLQNSVVTCTTISHRFWKVITKRAHFSIQKKWNTYVKLTLLFGTFKIPNQSKQKRGRGRMHDARHNKWVNVSWDRWCFWLNALHSNTYCCKCCRKAANMPAVRTRIAKFQIEHNSYENRVVRNCCRNILTEKNYEVK